ncbi:MAG: lytic transglycosylase [Pseudomonadota bacterium]
MRLPSIPVTCLVVVLSSCGGATSESATTPANPATRVQAQAQWDNLPGGAGWTQAVLDALDGPGAALIDRVPGDAAAFCPAFAASGPEARKAFWVSFLSVLAGEESTWREDVSGGGGRWHGLLQISPATARGYGCEATTADGLKSGEANLACGVRIMATTVARDGVIADGGGVAADWGPLTRARQRDKISAYTQAQSYCAQ